MRAQRDRSAAEDLRDALGRREHRARRRDFRHARVGVDLGHVNRHEASAHEQEQRARRRREEAVRVRRQRLDRAATPLPAPTFGAHRERDVVSLPTLELDVRRERSRAAIFHAAQRKPAQRRRSAVSARSARVDAELRVSRRLFAPHVAERTLGRNLQKSLLEERNLRARTRARGLSSRK